MTIPRMLSQVTGFPRMNKEMAMTNILLEALATEYVRGVTSESIEKARIF
jgi:hypothetical protein